LSGFLRGCLACDVGGREKIQNVDAKDNSYQTRNGCLGFRTARPVTVTVEFSLVYCSNAQKNQNAVVTALFVPSLFLLSPTPN